MRCWGEGILKLFEWRGLKALDNGIHVKDRVVVENGILVIHELLGCRI